MSYALTLGSVHVLAGGPVVVNHTCNCEEARRGCLPAFVFSVPGQVRFRSALHHLSSCRRRACLQLRARVIDSMAEKLDWLLTEESLLGCVHIQPALYGRERIVMQRSDFPSVGRHLARCPKESCAQLRRALLLTVRDSIRGEIFE
ncbi:MAG TPA: hypothetical protein VJC05_02265 [Candidatus Andersenbacteria bacterium]|nr:hypothetical protein [Candidatus Andersenbacteria bacterium]